MPSLRPTEVKHIYKEEEREAIRRQLERMLANPLFKNSRRYPALLRYVVEHTLAGNTSELKERTLGVEVFGREPDYDTNADPVVRAAAGEIRKRIAQYYHEHGHESEIRIELSPRSYIPEFEMPPAVPALAPAVVAVETSKSSYWRWMAITAATVVTVVTAVALAAWLKLWPPATPLDKFWGPVLDSASNVLLCVGQRGFMGSLPEAGQEVIADIPSNASGPITLFQLYYLGSQNVALTDVRALTRLAGLLQARGKTVHIRGQSTTNFSDLRDGPVVLVGAFNNDWTIRLMGPMRFSFEREGDIFWIKDRENPAKKNIAVNYRTPYLALTEDYALISRVLDPTTDRMVVVVGGLTGYGTIAAGEFLTDPVYFEEAISKDSPRNWNHKNVQLLLSTKVIHGNSGPPRIVDRYFW